MPAYLCGKDPIGPRDIFGIEECAHALDQQVGLRRHFLQTQNSFGA